MTREAVVLVAALVAVGCARESGPAAMPRRAPRALAARDDPGGALSMPGSRRRRIEGFREIPVVAALEASEVAYVVASPREETRRVHPRVGPDFRVTEAAWRAVTHRDAQCVSRDEPGETFRGTVREVRPAPSGRRRAQVVVAVDNARGILLPGMQVALAIDAGRETLVALGEVKEPDAACESDDGSMWVDPAYASLFR